MLAQVRSYTLFGLDAIPVTVEVDVSPGLPSYALVGLPDKAVEESRERVRAALKNSGFPYPQARVVVNLAPAELRKEGSHFDLPIALGLLAAQGVVPLESLSGLAVAGELGLDGSLRPVPGAVNLALGALGEGKRLLLPLESAKEAALVEGVEVYGAESLRQAVAYLRGEEDPKRAEPEDPVAALEKRGVWGATVPRFANRGYMDLPRPPPVHLRQEPQSGRWATMGWRYGDPKGLQVPPV
ncbi:magnesium chelatase domain-containing protein, partial [Thermus altitudinis]|uniref:magnesium chelatase domain-containing protein n=1 Tax=Thermus altitudinis TaxID=2908145 RepID=UPI0024300BD5